LQNPFFRVFIPFNIPQDIKWDEDSKKWILQTYLDLSKDASKVKPALIIWPEASFPGYLKEGEYFSLQVQQLARDTNTPLLIGALNLDEEEGENYNSAFLISPEGEIKKVYNKLHLVPFGEYIPLRKIFSFVEKTTPQIGNYNRGKEYTVFRSQGTENRTPNTYHRSPSFAVLICFEDLFPNLARKFTQKGTNFLINITNDAHYRISPAPWQHFTHSVFRAVENRTPVVRAANTGVSGFINSQGRITKLVRVQERSVGVGGWVVEEVSLVPSVTFYSRFGDLFVYANVFYLGILLGVVLRKRESEK